MDPMSEMDKTGLWEELWMQMILNRRELEEYQAIRDPVFRAEWIFKRAIVKDVVRMWLKRHCGLNLYPADVDVLAGADGDLSAGGYWLDELPAALHISVCYDGQVAVAAAGLRELSVATERVSGHGSVLDATLSARELELIHGWGGSDAAMTALCAKKAAAALLKTGPGGGPTPGSLAITQIDGGRILLTSEGAAARAQGRIAVHSIRDGDLVVAVACAQEEGWKNSAGSRSAATY
jgi:hypothetical protein